MKHQDFVEKIVEEKKIKMQNESRKAFSNKDSMLSSKMKTVLDESVELINASVAR